MKTLFLMDDYRPKRIGHRMDHTLMRKVNLSQLCKCKPAWQMHHQLWCLEDSRVEWIDKCKGDVKRSIWLYLWQWDGQKHTKRIVIPLRHPFEMLRKRYWSSKFTGLIVSLKTLVPSNFRSGKNVNWSFLKWILFLTYLWLFVKSSYSDWTVERDTTIKRLLDW